MIWQDWIISIGNFILFLGLLPSITSKNKPAKTTSLLYTFVLSAIVISLVSLELWLSAFGTLLNALAWGILFLQKTLKK